MEAVRAAQEAALASVMDAMHSALADRKGKRPAAAADTAGAAAPPPAKKRRGSAAAKGAQGSKMQKRIFGMDEPVYSDDDLSEGEVRQNLSRAARCCTGPIVLPTS